MYICLKGYSIRDRSGFMILIIHVCLSVMDLSILTPWEVWGLLFAVHQICAVSVQISQGMVQGMSSLCSSD